MNKGDKITIDYVCGHGSYELEIDSDDQKRNENRIKWFKENKVCTECYKKKMREEDKKKPQVINCSYHNNKKDCYISFVAEGNVDANIDKLKSVGFHWVKVDDQETKRKFHWELQLHYYINTLSELKSYLDEFRQKVTEIGYKLYTDMFGIPMEDIQNDLNDINKKKPKYNNCYESLKKEVGLLLFNSWNKKIYTPRNENGGHDYVCYIGKYKINLAEKDADQILDYQDKLDAYYCE